MVMFKKMIRLTGKHAEIVQKFCREKGTEQDIKFEVSNNNANSHMVNIILFDNKVDCYMVAVMLGIIYNKKAPVDKSSDTTASVFADMLDKRRDNLERIYRHMILAHSDDLNVDEKIKKAFTVDMTDEECANEQKELDNYARGGLEYLDELFGNCKTYEDIANAYFDLMEKISK